MRRLPAILLATTLTVPVTTLLPTVPLSAARPVPVRTSLTGFALSGVDAAALASPDNGTAVAAFARRAAAAVPQGQGAMVGRGTASPEPGGTGTGTAGAGGAPAARGSSATLVLTPPRSTAAFSSVGVTWDLPASGPTPGPVVVVRTHGARGWSAWTALDTDTGDTTDPSGGTVQRGGTAPLWVGPADGVQVRVDAGTGPAPTGLRVELVDPGRSAYDSRAGTLPPGSAAADTGQPVIIPRAGWGADERRVRSAPTLMPEIAAAVVHHTADANGYAASDVPAIIRSEYAYHLSRGWNDIGYNFLVDRFGRIWEGRRGGIAAAVQGAHAGGFNYRTFGVSVMGNYEKATPSAAALSALQRLLAWKLDLAHADPLGTTVLTAADFSGARWRAGTQVRVPVIMGHRDVDYTACPGARLYPSLSRIRSGVAALIRAELTNPSLAPGSVDYWTGGTAIRAGTLTGQRWTLTVSDCGARQVAQVSGSVPRRMAFRAGWDGRSGDGPARPGVYDLRLDSSAGTARARPWASTFVVRAPAAPPAPTGTVASGAGGLVPIAPVRLLDSRAGTVLATGAGGRVDVPVTGRGTIPAGGVLAVALAVTEVCPSAGTYLTVWPAGGPRPGTSNLNLPARGTRTATVVVPVGADGRVSITTAAGVGDVVVDALGYSTADSDARILPIGTARVLDTRTGGGRLAPGSTRALTLPALGGIPADRISGVIAQVTAGGATTSGYLEAQPGTAAPGASATLSYAPGGATVTLGVLAADGGRLTLTNRGSAVDVTVDVVAVVGSDPTATRRLTALPPVRAYDSRGGAGGLRAGEVRVVPVAGAATGVPDGAAAVLVNLTAVAGGSATGLTAWDGGADRPSRVDLQVERAGTRANLALVPLGADGRIRVTAGAGAAVLVVDVVGYLT